MRAFTRFHRRHPRDMGAIEISAFLNHLATERRVSASTHNQALCALVLSRREVPLVLERLDTSFRLVADILYGSGLRLLECLSIRLSIRVKDVDLERRQIMVRRGKGQKDRLALLPERIRGALRAQLDLVAERHRAELAAGRGEVDLPCALRAKLPSARSA